MKNLKKVLRILLIVCLIILAGFGVGLFGGIPAPNNSRRKDKTEVQTELKEEERKKDVFEKL